MQWIETSKAYAIANAQAIRAKQLIQEQQYSLGYEAVYEAQQVLKKIPVPYQEITLIQEIEQTLSQARQKWCEQIYEQAKLEASLQTKVGYLNALRLYRTCLNKIASFQDCEAQIAQIEHQLALLFYEEAQGLFQFPQLRYVGLATQCLKEAQRYDPHLPNLGQELQTALALCHAKLGITIQVEVMNGQDYGQELQNSLVQKIQDSQYPFIQAVSGAQDDLSQAYREKITAIRASAGDVPVQIYRLHLEVFANAAEKTGEASLFSKVSEYIAREHKIESSAYGQYLAMQTFLQTKQRMLSGLSETLETQVQERQHHLSMAEQQKNTDSRALALAESHKDEVQSRLNSVQRQRNEVWDRIKHNQRKIADLNEQIAEYRRKASTAQTPQERERYLRLAEECSRERDQLQHYNEFEGQRRLSQLDYQVRQAQRDIAQAEEEVSRCRRQYQYSVEEHRRAEQNYQNALESSQEIQSALEKAKREASRLIAPSQQEPVPIKAGYTYTYYPFQVYGTVWVRGYLIETATSQRLLPLEVRTEEKQEDYSQPDVKQRDARDLISKTEQLPTAAQFLHQLQTKTSQKVQSTLCNFLQQHHERYWQNAQAELANQHTWEAGEQLSLFLLCLENGKMPEHPEAKAKLQTILELPWQ